MNSIDFPLLFVRLDRKIHLYEKKLNFLSYQINWFVLQVYQILQSDFICHHTPLKPTVPKHVKRSRESPVKERLSSLNQWYRKAWRARSPTDSWERREECRVGKIVTCWYDFFNEQYFRTFVIERKWNRSFAAYHK